MISMICILSRSRYHTVLNPVNNCLTRQFPRWRTSTAWYNAAYQRRLDIAGGSARASITFAHRQPALRAMGCELPPLVSLTQAIVARYGMQERVTGGPGNFFRDDFTGGTILSSCQFPCRPKRSTAAG